ncbi:hypothetical protein SFRURICE_006948, partial [Spodoptera frugiperda]
NFLLCHGCVYKHITYDNFWITQKVAPRGNPTRYTLRGCLLLSHRYNHAVCIYINGKDFFGGVKIIQRLPWKRRKGESDSYCLKTIPFLLLLFEPEPRMKLIIRRRIVAPFIHEKIGRRAHYGTYIHFSIFVPLYVPCNRGLSATTENFLETRKNTHNFFAQPGNRTRDPLPGSRSCDFHSIKAAVSFEYSLKPAHPCTASYLFLSNAMSRLFIPEEVSRGAHYATYCRYTMYTQFFTIFVKSLASCYYWEGFDKPKKKTVILSSTRESNPRPLDRQSHLQPLDQRGSHTYFSSGIINVMSIMSKN